MPVTHDRFSGFIFKIQANMDPKHRDRIAFLRVCSGKFERDMTVIHARTAFTKADGSPGGGRYTDGYAKIDGRWLAVFAHVTRL